MSYFGVPQKTEGTERQAVVSDEDLAQLLMDILKELKKMNIQLELLTDDTVTNEELN